MNLRDDLQLIHSWTPVSSRVLDLGRSNGESLAALVGRKECSGYGVEIDTDSVIEAISRDVSVIQASLEQGLEEFGDNTFDVIVLSQTTQSMQNAEMILCGPVHMVKQTVVISPNFGHWYNRFQIVLGSHMPASEQVPHHWHSMPNIHWCTLEGFDLLCAKNNVRVFERAVMIRNKRVKHLPSLLGSLMFYRVGQ